MEKEPQLNPVKTAVASIASVANLCTTLNVTQQELDAALNLDPVQKYRSRTVPKKDGSDRVVFRPDHRLRKIQRRINKRIFATQSVVSWPDHLFGSIPNQIGPESIKIEKDYVACARRHCESKSILKIDIKNFFDNISEFHVKDIFVNFFKYSDDVAQVLADLCCHNGNVIQGALTSSYVAGLCLYDVEGDVVRRLARKGLVYTRLVDDITVSSKSADFDFGYAKSIIQQMLIGKDLPINESKTVVQYVSTTPLTVHGLRVGFKQPRLPSDEVKRIRSAVKNIETLAKEDSYRVTHGYRHDFNRAMGRVNKLGRVQHKQHEPLVKRMKKVLPLPSKKDIERATRIIDRLQADHAAKHNTYWYWKRFYLAHERLNVLQRSFPEVSKKLRTKLRSLRSTYE